MMEIMWQAGESSSVKIIGEETVQYDKRSVSKTIRGRSCIFGRCDRDKSAKGGHAGWRLPGTVDFGTSTGDA